MVLIIFFKITEHTYLCLFILWADPLLFIFIFFLEMFRFLFRFKPNFPGMAYDPPSSFLLHAK